MRNRQVHPDFWKSDTAGELDFFGRLLFVALWCMADREGLVLYRPRRISVEAFPFDGISGEQIVAAVDKMKSLGMVEELSNPSEKRKCLKVVNFKEYQTIHPKEAKSKLIDRYIPGNSAELHVIPGNSRELPPDSDSDSDSDSTSVGTEDAPLAFSISAKQKDYAGGLLSQAGESWESWAGSKGLSRITAKQVDEIVAGLKDESGREKAALDRKNAMCRELKAALDEVHTRDGPDAARKWIRQQAKEFHGALWGRFKEIDQ